MDMYVMKGDKMTETKKREAEVTEEKDLTGASSCAATVGLLGASHRCCKKKV